MEIMWTIPRTLCIAHPMYIIVYSQILPTLVYIEQSLFTG